MNRHVRLAGLAFLALLLGSLNGTLAGPQEEASFEMTPSSELRSLTQGQILGRDAEPAEKANWPATYTFRNPAGAGCTATAVGPLAVLTAAHCVRNGGKGKIASEQGPVDLVCDHHPKYEWNDAHDFALCKSASPVAKPTDGFERIETDVSRLKTGDKVVLLGYGCLMEGGKDRNFGTLYQGTAPIVELPGVLNRFIVTVARPYASVTAAAAPIFIPAASRGA